MKENNSNNSTNMDTIKSLTKVYISEGVYGIEETGLLYIEPEYYNKVSKIDVQAYIKKKNGLDYIPYQVSLMYLREYYPGLYVESIQNNDGGFLHKQNITETNTIGLLYFKVTNGIYSTPIEPYVIYDFKNKPTPLDRISETDIYNNRGRGIAKVLSLYTGIGRSVYLQEDLEEYRIKQDLIEQVNSLYNQLDQKGVLIEIRDVSNMSVAQLNNHIQLLNKNLVESAKRKVSIEKIIDLQSQLENKGVMLSDYPSLEKLSLEEITQYGKSLKEQLQKVN